MQCPSCALYHPARYERCVSCGTNLVADGEAAAKQAPPVTTKHSRGTGEQQRPARPSREPRARTQNEYSEPASDSDDRDNSDDNNEVEEPAPRLGFLKRRKENSAEDGEPRKKGGLPVVVGVAIAGFILCASAGVTYFVLTKPPENERLLKEGTHQLALGQYAFALKTLGEASKAKPNDPKALLALARAYVGVDQVDKAWACITQAQALGTGVVADPALASDLANYYRQHNQHARAIELLRPLSTQNIPGKKAELADLDASFGDECMRTGNLKQAMQAWEEVKELHEGSRFSEADSRLSSIYQKIAEQVSGKGDQDEALKYYGKLNAMAPSPSSLERAAELYQKQGNLSLAIDQMTQAVKLGGDASFLNRKLASMMAARGKELIDKGEVDSGYGYLQKAQSLDTHIRVPSATVRGAHVDIDPSTGFARFTGEVWNPGPADLGSVTVRGELYDTKLNKVLSTKEHRVIDEFVPPLGMHETKAFELLSTVAPTDPATTELRIYLNNALYKTYPLKGKGAIASEKPVTSTPTATTTDSGGNWRMAPRIQPPVQTSTTTTPPVAPTTVNPDTTPSTAPTVAPGPSSEEKTMKDLD